MIKTELQKSYMTKKLCRLMAFIVGVGINFDHYSVMGVSVVTLIIIIYLFLILSLYGGIKVSANEQKFYWLPIAYLFLLIILNAFNCNEVSDTIIPVSFIFCLILYYISIVHIKNDPKTIVSFLSGITVGGVLMTLFFNLGVGVEYESGRLFLFGSNPNNLGCLMCISAAIILYALIIKDHFKIKIFRYFFVVLLVPIVQVVFATASRTAFFALAIVFAIAFIMTPTKRKITKVFYFVVFAAIIYAVYITMAEYETLYLRVVEIGENEDYTSGREGRWETLFNYALQNPLGLGQTGYAKIAKPIYSSSEINGEASPHNVFLEVLLYTGFLGLTIMSFFWFHIIKKAWLYYKENKDLLLLLIMSVLFAQMMLGQILISRVAWIVFGIVVGASLQNNSNKTNNIVYGRL